MPRASRLQAMSRANKTNFHLPDGPGQQVRDARMTSGTTDWAAGSVAVALVAVVAGAFFLAGAAGKNALE